MKRILIILCLVLAAGCQKKPAEILVNKIEFSPSNIRMFVGDQLEIQAACYPANATNLDQLTTSVLDPSIANFQDGKLTALVPGNTKLQARCGAIYAQTPVTVYAGWFAKDGQKYGVDSVSGYYSLLEEDGSARYIEIDLEHLLSSGESQHFWFMILTADLGKTLDFTAGAPEAMVAVYKNNNEDGYTIYTNDELQPVIRTADWSDPGDVSLIRGLLTVTQLSDISFRISADFTLSSSYTFGADWEGKAAVKPAE